MRAFGSRRASTRDEAPVPQPISATRRLAARSSRVRASARRVDSSLPGPCRVPPRCKVHHQGEHGVIIHWISLFVEARVPIKSRQVLDLGAARYHDVSWRVLRLGVLQHARTPRPPPPKPPDAISGQQAIGCADRPIRTTARRVLLMVNRLAYPFAVCSQHPTLVVGAAIPSSSDMPGASSKYRKRMNDAAVSGMKLDAESER